MLTRGFEGKVIDAGETWNQHVKRISQNCLSIRFMCSTVRGCECVSIHSHMRVYGGQRRMLTLFLPHSLLCGLETGSLICPEAGYFG